jgi:hypothetical protein
LIDAAWYVLVTICGLTPNLHSYCPFCTLSKGFHFFLSYATKVGTHIFLRFLQASTASSDADDMHPGEFYMPSHLELTVMMFLANTNGGRLHGSFQQEERKTGGRGKEVTGADSLALS